ncbi:RNA-binding S4 domain-containing protein [Parathalassolituus penaei]|uniref:RNA-binding S4 domain-containing protein n=1 Tax=Parathalassolituus penaei TaxID=2997323 RepID=A0A9X3ITH2_9GAMM|nr:RNA-binding S4 domain-containing protein [Parathalassolituus penaei]MCY0965889.1 RNA-binding S4 domain-containing protein [Parathalassolituus penaei]
MKEIIINHEPVELYKILKFEAIASSGGEAKIMIEQEQVLVNGEIETRKRKKIMSGDVIETQGVAYRIVLGAE